jgi:hypothetical protein
VDAAKRDFRLPPPLKLRRASEALREGGRPDAKALTRLGLRPIPFEEIGCYR